MKAIHQTQRFFGSWTRRSIAILTKVHARQCPGLLCPVSILAATFYKTAVNIMFISMSGFSSCYVLSLMFRELMSINIFLCSIRAICSSRLNPSNVYILVLINSNSEVSNRQFRLHFQSPVNFIFNFAP
jgi:hypothetical protein